MLRNNPKRVRGQSKSKSDPINVRQIDVSMNNKEYQDEGVKQLPSMIVLSETKSLKIETLKKDERKQRKSSLHQADLRKRKQDVQKQGVSKNKVSSEKNKSSTDKEKMEDKSGYKEKEKSELRKTKIPKSVKQSIVRMAPGRPLQQNNQQLAISKSIIFRIRKMKQKIFNCEICTCEYTDKQKRKIGHCQHYFCDSCIRHYVEYKISRFQEVYCPAEDCPQKIDKEGGFYKSLSQKLKQKFKRIQAFYTVAKNPNLRLCPDENCIEGILNLSQGQILKCNKCQKIYCPKCLFPSHSGECQQNQVAFFQDNLKFRQCSKCKIIIQRIEGCNHITCQCSYQFCYVCGAMWIPNVAHICGQEPTFVQVSRQRCFNCTDQCCRSCGCIKQILGCLFRIFICIPIYLCVFLIIVALAITASLIALAVAILMGILPYACSVLCQLQNLFFVFGLVFYPIVILVGIFKAISQFYLGVMPYILMFTSEIIVNSGSSIVCW